MARFEDIVAEDWSSIPPTMRQQLTTKFGAVGVPIDRTGTPNLTQSTRRNPAYSTKVDWNPKDLQSSRENPEPESKIPAPQWRRSYSSWGGMAWDQAREAIGLGGPRTYTDVNDPHRKQATRYGNDRVGPPPPPIDKSKEGPGGPDWRDIASYEDFLSLENVRRMGRAAVSPSPYAPMTWIERNTSAEGRADIYGRGMATAPLYGYKTGTFHIHPSNTQFSKSGLLSERVVPAIPENPEPGAYDPGWNNGMLPSMREGGRSSGGDLLHRSTTAGPGGNIWLSGAQGDPIHTPLVTGYQASVVQPIKAASPEVPREG